MYKEEQITVSELSELLDNMSNGEQVEIITGDYIEKVCDNCFILNNKSQFEFSKQQIIDNVIEKFSE